MRNLNSLMVQYNLLLAKEKKYSMWFNHQNRTKAEKRQYKPKYTELVREIESKLAEIREQYQPTDFEVLHGFEFDE